MDLMTLAAKIVLDDSSYNKGISNAEKAGQQLAGKMSAMTVAVGNIAADMVKKAVSGISNVIGSAVEGFADYEQLIGGVETLFKVSANKVEKYAKQSFKTTGLSANDYMETVTSFSAALIKGLGGDTQAAAEMANTAITDMADNANKMGTDISAIQVAYQGFAKQNYTMLDNLKLGYGGTQSEMVRLINDSGILNKKIEDLDGITFDQIVRAIHEIQTQMGITGTTAKEAAETISGSKQSMMAAWEDFVTAAAGEGGKQRLDETKDQFVEAFSTYVNNLAPILTTSIANAPTIIDAVADGITAIPSKSVAKLAEGGLGALTAIFNGGTELAGWFIDGLVQMFRDINADPTQIADLGNSIGTFIGSALSDIIENAPVILTGLFNAGVTLAGSLIEGLFSGLFGNKSEVEEITEGLQDGLIKAEYTSTKAGALITYLDNLVSKYGDAANKTTEWKEAVKALEEVLPGANELIDSQAGNLKNAVEMLESYNKQVRDLAIVDALQNASADEMKLLATQTLEYNKQQARYNRNQSIRDQTRQDVIDAIRSEAAAKAAEIDAQGGPVGAGQTDYYNKLISLSEGMSHVGDRMTELSKLNFDDLKGELNFLDSETFTDEWLEGRKRAYDEADAEMNAAEQAMADSQQDIEATRQAIADTKAAMDQTVLELLGSGSSAAASILAGGSDIASALHSTAGAIRGGGLGKYGISYMPNATGIDNVPFDGFRAELHRGEMVMTASQANRYREGEYGSTDVVNAIRQLGEEMKRLKFIVGEREFGQAVVDYGYMPISRKLAGELESGRYRV